MCPITFLDAEQAFQVTVPRASKLNMWKRMSHYSGLQSDFIDSSCNTVEINALWTFSFNFYSINWCSDVVVLTTYSLVFRTLYTEK